MSHSTPRAVVSHPVTGLGPRANHGLPASEVGTIVQRLRIGPVVLQYLPGIGTVRDERDQPHLPTAHRTQQREHVVLPSFSMVVKVQNVRNICTILNS